MNRGLSSKKCIEPENRRPQLESTIRRPPSGKKAAKKKGLAGT